MIDDFSKEVKTLRKRIKDYEEKIELINDSIANGARAVATFEEFVELFKKVPIVLNKTTDLKKIKFILENVWSNFSFDDQKMPIGQLKTPYRELYDKGFLLNCCGAWSRTRPARL